MCLYVFIDIYAFMSGSHVFYRSCDLRRDRDRVRPIALIEHGRRRPTNVRRHFNAIATALQLVAEDVARVHADGVRRERKHALGGSGGPCVREVRRNGVSSNCGIDVEYSGHELLGEWGGWGVY